MMLSSQQKDASFKRDHNIIITHSKRNHYIIKYIFIKDSFYKYNKFLIDSQTLRKWCN